MRPKLFSGDDGSCSPQNDALEINDEYARRLEYNRKREDLQRYDELDAQGLIDDDEEEEDLESDDDGDVDYARVDTKFLDVLIKVKKKDPSIFDSSVSFFPEMQEKERKEIKEKEKERKEIKEKKNQQLLKDVQAKQLLEDGPEFVEEEEEDKKKSQTPAEVKEALRQELRNDFEAGGSESDGEDDFLREKEKEDDEEVDEELVKKMDEYFGEEDKIDENEKFLKEFILKRMWKEKDSKTEIEAEVERLEEDFVDIWEQIDWETGDYRHEENAGDVVMGQSRVVEGSVRKTDSSRKVQRKKKEERMKAAEIERQEELKRLKNVKRKEIKEKMKKVLSVAGFKEGEECPLDRKALDDEFDPDEYDQMMKAVFDEEYYGAEDSDLNSDEDDDGGGEKPEFDKEDELLGLPKDWDVIKGGDGFKATRERVLKLKEIDDGGDGGGDGGEGEEEEEEAEREEGKRKRKKKPSLVQKAKEALMEEYYKLDYEGTIGDLKTRFPYTKVRPSSYEMDTSEILVLDDSELNQYVPLKKIAPYVEKDWEVNKYKVREQKQKIREKWERDGSKEDEKRSKKRKKSDVEETEPAEEKKADEAETSKLSKKAKRRRRQAEKKLPPNRMVAYGKAN